MTFLKINTAIFVLISGITTAEDSPTTLQCEGNLQQGSQKTETPIEPFSVEIKDKVVKLTGVSNLGSAFSLIQNDQKSTSSKMPGRIRVEISTGKPERLAFTP